MYEGINLNETPNNYQIGGKHYKGGDRQHWDVIAENRIGYLEGVASKYVLRWREKNGLEDLEKCKHYIEKIRQLNHNVNYQPSGAAYPSDIDMLCEKHAAGPLERSIVEVLLSAWRLSELDQAWWAVCNLIESARGNQQSPAA